VWLSAAGFLSNKNNRIFLLKLTSENWQQQQQEEEDYLLSDEPIYASAEVVVDEKEEEEKDDGGSEVVAKLLAKTPVVLFAKSTCPWCKKIKDLLAEVNIKKDKLTVIEVDKDKDGARIHKAVAKLAGRTSVPQLFIGGMLFGGFDDTHALHQMKRLVPLLTAAKAV